MELPRSEFVTAPMVGSGSIGLLLSRDLIFTSKIVGTAAELGYSMLLADTELKTRTLIETQQPAVILVDLTAGEMVGPAFLTAYHELASPKSWLVAFGSHIEPAVLAAAKAAGCHIAMPRSRFAAELPRLLSRFFSQPATSEE